MIPKRVQAYLDKIEVEAEAIAHRTVYTAYDLAQTTGLKLEQVTKTILLKVDPSYGEDKSKYVIAVLPASHQLNLDKLKKILKAKKISITNEASMAKTFKIKAGALTPFGPLHKNTPVIIDKALTKSRKIVARTGSFTESLLLKSKDFLKATGGELAIFAKKGKAR